MPFSLARRTLLGRAGAAMLLAPLAAWSQDPAPAARPLPDAAAVARYAATLLDRLRIDPQGPGVAVLVARGDELLLQTARGLANREQGVPLDPSQRLHIGSVTKQFSAALLLRLVDEGRAALDDPLSKFLPAYPNGQAITLAMLLNHTSGVDDYTRAAGYWNRAARQNLDTAQTIDTFKDRAVDFAPGTRWSYNNSGYVLVGAVIEAITGRPWWDDLSAVKAPVFHPSREGGIPGLVTGYTRRRDGTLEPAWPLGVAQGHAAGVLAADVQSLWRWNQQLHEGGFLKPATYRRMTTPEGEATGPGYGYGLSTRRLRGRPMLYHDGRIRGFSAQMLYLPNARVTVALLRNADEGMNLYLLGDQLAAFAAGRPFPMPQPIAMEAAQLAQFEGVYGTGVHQRRLRMFGGVLTSQRGGGDVAPLVPVGPARFAYPNVEQVAFEQDAAGRVTGLRFFFEGDDEGQFHARIGDAP